jgi:pyridoxamine 5'-phosphate oxidase
MVVALLDEGALGDEPMAEVARWIDDAVAAGLPEPTAMQLATVSRDGQPSVRTVLLRGWGPDGFRFFTNLQSAKADHLAAEARCGLVLFWHRPLLRQVCVRGRAVRLDRPDVEAYWSTRPRGSRLGAWASPQSRVIASRAELDARVGEVAARFGDGDVPLPDHWGGYLVVPSSVELWQGQDDRLHDRIRWRRTGDGWIRERLAP